MANKIKHDGKIKNILDGKHLQVLIVQSSACSSCKIASHCSSSESKEKIIDVWTRDTSKYQVGQTVNVVAETGVGMNAVALGFAIPLIIMTIVIATLLYILPEAEKGEVPYNQAYAALAGIAALVPYYGLLWLNKSRIQKAFTFSIESE